MKEQEYLQISYPVQLDQEQWDSEWLDIIDKAGQPRAHLEQVHILMLAHMIRRPIIMHGISGFTDHCGVIMQRAFFAGVYLPFLLDAAACDRNPIVLGYTRGHFTALLAQPQPSVARPLATCAAWLIAPDNNLVLFNDELQQNLWPIGIEATMHAEECLRCYMDIGVTAEGKWMARQTPCIDATIIALHKIWRQGPDAANSQSMDFVASSV